MQMRNILIMTKGTGGDLVPFLAIARNLRDRNHRVGFLTHCGYERVVRQTGAEFMPLDSPDEFEHFIADGELLNKPGGISVFFKRHYLPKVHQEYEIIRNWLGDRRDSVLVTRHMAGVADVLASECLSIPLVRVYTAVAQVTTLPFLQELCRSHLAGDINAIRMGLNLSSVTDWHAWLISPSQSLATWPVWFADLHECWPPRSAAIGFINDDESETGELPEELRELMESDPAPILITAGLGTFLGTPFYSAAAAACNLLGRPGILVTRHQGLVPNPLPPTVKWYSQLPFADVMPRVAAVIHHGGTSTLARAIASGVPQLVLPYGADRPDTALRLKRLGVAEYLLPPRWAPELIAEAISRLLVSPTIRRRCEELAERTAGMKPVETACDLIESVIPTETT
jgi:rhamnosyltransferase subunit B